MIHTHNKLKSRNNTYPFRTCPICGLTYSIMGDNPPIFYEKKTKPEEKIKIISPKEIENEQKNGSLLINIDSMEEYLSYNEPISEKEEISLIDLFVNDIELGVRKQKYYNEKREHVQYCERFKSAERKYSPHVLTYQKKIFIIKTLMPMLKINKNSSEKEDIINSYMEIIFTESLEMVGCSLSHPKFEEFSALLWNTQWFLKEISEFLSNNEIEAMKNKYPQNDGLRKNLRWWSLNKLVDDCVEDEYEDVGYEDDCDEQEFEYDYLDMVMSSI